MLMQEEGWPGVGWAAQLDTAVWVLLKQDREVPALRHQCQAHVPPPVSHGIFPVAALVTQTTSVSPSLE